MKTRAFPLRAQSGLTLIELMVCCLLALLLFIGYLRVTRHYQEEMEEISVRLTISRIQVGMALEWARRIGAGDSRRGTGELVGANPVRWLDEPPHNYLGELKAPKLDKLTPGRWLFDLSRKELVYIVDNGDNLTFKNSFEPVKVLRWHVRLAGTEPGEKKDTEPEFGELKLMPVYEYRWF